MTELNSENGRNSRAGLLRRLAALLYDGFLVVAIWMLLGFLIQLIVGPDTSTLVNGRVETDPFLDVITFSLMMISSALFYIWFWIRSGQTLGMIAWRIKVEKSDGGLISPGQGLVRFVAAWPAFLLLGLGYFWLYIDADRDALHDKLSRSKVIVVSKDSRPL